MSSYASSAFDVSYTWYGSVAGENRGRKIGVPGFISGTPRVPLTDYALII